MEMYELRLSTTDAVPGTLDRVFDQNRGDDEVVVYRGPLRWETDCSGPPEGPRDFDYIVDLQTAFPYDPSWGRSLLVEEHASFQTNVAPFTDTHDFPGEVRAIASLPHAASVAQYHIERAFVRGFEFATLPGDFDHNGVLDVADVNLLQQEIVAGPPGAEFDLNSDDRVDGEDLRIWVKDLKHTWIGDANLDREFSSGDLIVVFQAGEYEDDVLINSTWGTGDWNGDAEFDSSDLVTAFQDGGYERGPRPAVATVPEPNSIPLFLAGLVFFLFPTGARL